MLGKFNLTWLAKLTSRRLPLSTVAGSDNERHHVFIISHPHHEILFNPGPLPPSCSRLLKSFLILLVGLSIWALNLHGET